MPLNPESSRSHGIFLLKIVKTDRATYHKTRSTLYFADLMGSEAMVVKDDGSSTIDESASINQDLLVLTRVIKALSDPKGVPAVYRDSTLTYVLRDVLGGNSKTAVLVTCSPHIMQYVSTEKTLKFGDDCKGIRREVKRNVMNFSKKELETLLHEKLAIIAALQREIEELMASGGGGGATAVKQCRRQPAGRCGALAAR